MDTISEITDKSFAVGRALGIKMGLPQTAESKTEKQRPGTENRRM